MDAYERSLKQQADRIRRELSQEGKKAAPAPKIDPPDEFVPTDVPSPIYGYARPKPKINLPDEHSPETRTDFTSDSRETVTERDVPSASTSESFVSERSAAVDKFDRTTVFNDTLSQERVVLEDSYPVDEPTVDETEATPPIEAEPEQTSAEETVLESIHLAKESQADRVGAAEPVTMETEVSEETTPESVDEVEASEATEPVTMETEVSEETTPELVDEVEASEAMEPMAMDAKVSEETASESVDEVEASEAMEPVTMDAESRAESNISTETDNGEESTSDDKPSLGDVSIVEGGFASVFMGSTDLKASKLVVREDKDDVSFDDMTIEASSVEEVAPIVEDVAKTLQAEPEAQTVEDETELTPAVSVSYKAEGPPLNVMMTPQDRMAMYRSRRLAQKNNNL
ncbi:hypothetical protein [Exiguobacterium aurantiacum]|uniref:Uncharacterized protein n=1 Tax=Exiguobacterium aurantiacum TaxID=33987 RepID=A0A377FTR0_9BACL|nr:hypothetical protein [Exiguobacterium aurantiacum]STO07703.1 Uncharacterised protein [Exiguobacterium aurantiacum]